MKLTIHHLTFTILRALTWLRSVVEDAINLIIEEFQIRSVLMLFLNYLKHIWHFCTAISCYVPTYCTHTYEKLIFSDKIFKFTRRADGPVYVLLTLAYKLRGDGTLQQWCSWTRTKLLASKVTSFSGCRTTGKCHVTINLAQIIKRFTIKWHENIGMESLHLTLSW